MNDRFASYQDIFLDLFREMVLPVYRYHLVRSGDWHQAQNLTAATFLEALRWFDLRIKGSHKEKIWLFGIAAGMQMRRVKDGYAFASGDASIVPTQEQMAQFVKTTEVYEKWRLLPRKQADALAFTLFAGLEINEVAEILGWDVTDVMEKIGVEFSRHNDLKILANAIEPVGFFTRWLENDVRETSSHRTGPERIRIGLRLLQASYQMGPILTFLSRVVPVLLFIGLLIWGIWAVTHQDEQGNPPEMKATTPARITFTPNVLRFSPSGDSLVLADQEGRIYLQSLADDQKTYLSTVGFYREDLMDPFIPPTISPDGKWFSIARLGNQGTWLLSMDGKEAIKVIDRPVKLAWSPDGEQVAFGDPVNPAQIRIYRINNHVARPVALSIGKAVSMAWSPDGKKIGVVSDAKRTEMDQHLGGERQYIQLNIGIYDLATQQFQVIKSFDDSPVDPESSRFDLMWTEDSKELWLPTFRMAFSIADQGEHELLAQPFLDNYGVQSALLGYTAGGWQNQAVLSPDQKFLAVVNNMANGTPGTVYVHPVSEIYLREWVDSFPILKSYGQIDWTEEGKNLIFSEKVSGPGKVLRIEAATGRWQEVAQYVQFFGTRSGLMRAGANRAPQVQLIRSSQAASSVQRWTDVSDPGTGMHLRLPADWHVWTYRNNQNSALALANFDFANPWGFASLYDKDVLLWITTNPRQHNNSIRTQLEAMARGYEPGTFTFEPLKIDGVEAYLETSELPDHITYKSVWIATKTDDILISTTPAAHEWDTILNQIMQSIHFDGAVKLPLVEPPTPTPQANASSNQAAWREYQDRRLGITFEVPEVFLQSNNTSCSVYESNPATVHLGPRIFVTVVDPGGKSLADYVSSVTFNNTSQWSLVTQDSFTLSGDPVINKTYKYWGENIKEVTFVMHQNKIYALNYSSDGTCNFPGQGITEEKAYQHLIDTLRFNN